MEKLVNNIKRAQVSTAIDHRDTLAYVVFDGLSASESFFMEALDEPGRFPCLFVGGSAGNKSDFKKTLFHEGKRSYQNHAQIVFIKTPADIRFGVETSDTHWCSDGFEFRCEDGAKLSLTFALDCCDREAIGWLASPTGYSGDDIRA